MGYTDIRYLLATVCALSLLQASQGQTTTYAVNLTGSQNLPAVTTSASAALTISFNTASNNITYNLAFVNVPDPTAAHIHINAGPSANGSVAIPLWMGDFSNPSIAPPANGLVASNTVTPPTFTGPLEILPDYNNPNVSSVLSEYIQSGLAYAQVHTLEYPTGFIRGNFQSGNSQVIGEAVVPLSAPLQALPVASLGGK